MAPNAVDVVPPSESRNGEVDTKATTSQVPRPFNVGTIEGTPMPAAVPRGQAEGSNMLKTYLNTLNTLAHIFIGVIVSVLLIFAFRNGTPLTATPLHIVLCVPGYQLLMAEAILSLSESNGWSSSLRLKDKRLAHLILQVSGSALAIAGSIVKILDKNAHWDTLHGQFALVAFVFTTVSVVNGFASFWAFELRKVFPQNLSKLTHICFGTVGFVSANICLCYGLEKVFFRNWLGDSVAYGLIATTAALCFVVIVIPVFNFSKRTVAVVKR